MTSTIPTTDLYFEAHITTDPIPSDTDDALARAWVILHAGQVRGFRVADLLMRKGDAWVPHTADAFFSTRSNSYPDVIERTREFVAWLARAGVKVRRFKIENTLVDVRHDGSFLDTRPLTEEMGGHPSVDAVE